MDGTSRAMGSSPVVDLPPSLRFGASSAAYQIEGAVAVDGRGESIWDRFCRVPGAIVDGSSGDPACDHYHRWAGDLDLVAELGLDAYRFSIAWPRIQPEGRGALNPRAVDFYRRVLAGLRERGVDPVVTLYHADLPAALQDRGGWAARDTIGRFSAYADGIASELGNLVAAWITHNEPWGVAFAGHAEGVKAPGVRDWSTALQVAHHLLVSHGQAVQAIRAHDAAATVGISLNLAHACAASSSEADAQAARRQDGYVNRWFLDPLFRAAYPADGLERFARHGDSFEIQDGDLAAIATPIDFLGINAYHPDWVRDAAGRGPCELDHVTPPPPTSTLGWQLAPDALGRLLDRLARDYGPRPIWITENGVPDDAKQPAHARLRDHHRIAYLAGHLEAVAAAVARGVDVRRYFVWSLLDSFEWELGWRAPFGLIHVDPNSQRRTPKDSAWWYRDTIARSRAARDPRNDAVG